MQSNSPTPEVLDYTQFKYSTPGRWEVGEYGTIVTVDYPANPKAPRLTIACGLGTQSQIGLADARLIALAPELLSRLQAAESQLALVTREREQIREQIREQLQERLNRSRGILEWQAMAGEQRRGYEQGLKEAIAALTPKEDSNGG